MASLTRTAAAALVAAGLLAVAGGAYAQTAPQADFDACNRMAQASSAGATSLGSGGVTGCAGLPGTGGSTTMSGGAGAPSASPRAASATDPQLTGMDAAGHANAAYQQTFGDGMKQRGF